jgi:bacteriocin resistance YdeI/OmpD-like protein
VSAENRAAAGVAAGDELAVVIALDTAPREVLVPDDLAEALAASAEARHFYEALTYSDRRAHVLSIEGAKSPETRQRRIDRALEKFLAGKVRENMCSAQAQCLAQRQALAHPQHGRRVDAGGEAQHQ